MHLGKDRIGVVVRGCIEKIVLRHRPLAHIPVIVFLTGSILPLLILAHSVISLRCGIWSLSGHSGHRANHSNQARFMSTRPSLTCQWHCAVRIRLARGWA